MEKDVNGILSDTPTMFSRMTRLYGLKEAIYKLVKMVEQENPGDVSS